MSCDSYSAAFGAKRTSVSGCLIIAVYEYTHQVVLTKLVLFPPDDLVDRLCVLIPMLCLAAVTNLEGISERQKTSVRRRKLISFIASGDVATLAKIAALHVDMVPADRETSLPQVLRPHV